MKRSKKILLRLAVLATGCVAALAAAEVLVRIVDPHARDHVLPYGLIGPDRKLGWALEPGAGGRHHSRHFDVYYANNALGNRDRDRTVERDEGMYRVLLYGDSQVFGWGVETHERFTDLLEQALEQVEIWNLGVPGYGLDQQVLAYEQHGEVFNGDEVMLLVSPITVDRMRVDYIYKKPKPKFSIDSGGKLALQPVSRTKLTSTAVLLKTVGWLQLPYFLERRLARWEGAPDEEPGANRTGLVETERTKLKDCAQQLAERAILRVARLTRERSQRLTLIVVVQERDFKEFCERESLRCVWVETSPGFRFGADDGHWTPDSHRRVAEQLEPQLRKLEPFAR